MLQLCCCLPVNRTCFNIADVCVSKQSSHRSAISSIDLAHRAFFFFFLFTEKRLRFKRRLSEKPVSTGNLQGHALDITLECRLMGNREAVGESRSPATLQYVRRCTHAPAVPHTARVGAYRCQINSEEHTQMGTL